MSKKIFAQGDVVYSVDGQAANYVARSDGGHIVLPLVEGYDGEDGDVGPAYSYELPPTLWRDVFTEPPVAKFSDELKVLHEKIGEARAQLDALKSQADEAEYNHQCLLKRLKKFEQLRYIEDFLDDKITHYAYMSDYGNAEIIPLAEAMCRSDRFNPRLLALYGDRKNRTVSWMLHQYSDSSGAPSSGQWMPARSEEEARECIRTFITQQLARGDAHQMSYLTSFVRAANKWGVPVQQKFQERADAEAEEGRQRRLANAQKAFDDAKRNLEAETGKVEA